MKPIFTNVLSNGTNRDLFGSYAAFNSSRVHQSLASAKEHNGKRENSVSNFRKNFSIEAKELAKTTSLNKALRNITDYLSLIGRARSTLQSVEDKLLLLEDTINESSGVVDAEDYVDENIGAIATVKVSGKAADAKTFTNLPPSSTSGKGKGASFTIQADGFGNYNVTNINSEGKDYEAGDTITIKGDLLGGKTTENDAKITVNATSSVTKRVLLDEMGNEIKFASDDLERQGLQLEANNLVTEVTAIINGSEFWDEDIFGGLRAVGYVQVGFQASENTLVDIQKLSTTEIGTITEAGFLNTDFSIRSDIEGTLVVEDTVSSSGNSASMYGWNIGLQQVSLGPYTNGSDAASGSITKAIGGSATPTDSTPTPQNTDSPAQVSRGDDYLASGGTFSYSISGTSLILTSDNLTVNGGDVVHGPYLISDNAVDLYSGDKVSFSWKADVTDNAFDVYSYLLNSSTGAKVELLDQYGNSDTSFGNVETTISSNGSYYFVFVAGTFDYDFTGTITGTESLSGNSTVSGVTAASVSGSASAGVASVTRSGTSSGVASYNNVTQDSTSGSGSGAAFNISTNGSGGYTVTSISASGSGYSTSDTITINGSKLGGADGTNNLVLTVASINSSRFNSLSQSSTSGSGSGAVFSITANANGSYTLNNISSLGSSYSIGDTIAISGSSLGGTNGANNATLTVSSVGAKTFSGVSQASTSASGSGGVFQIRIDGSGGHTISSITSGGSNYEVGDTVTISGSNLGGTTPSNDLTFTIGTIDATAGASVYIKDLSIERQEVSDDLIGGIDLSTQSAASAAATVVANAIKQIQYRNSYLSGKELALTSSINEITVQQAASNLLLPPAGSATVEKSVRELKRGEIIWEVLKQVQRAQSLSNTGILKLITKTDKN